MPELRRDPVVDRWVIISADRKGRPFDTGHGVAAPDPQGFERCPFCPGHESHTPPEVCALGRDGSPADTPGWSLRVVPNKYPALTTAGGADLTGDDLYRAVSGIGFHEVIVETPSHHVRLEQLPLPRIADLFVTVKRRFLHHASDPRVACVHAFKNHGGPAGASLSHPHSQIIAMPVVSKLVAEELAGARERFMEHERCVYCRMLERELADGSRVVAASERFVAITPWAPRFPYETMILPRTHHQQYESASGDDLADLAALFAEVMGRIDHLCGDPPYNVVWHSAPFRAEHHASYHWHLKLMPVLGKVAGFEWGSGFHINTVSPEEAARRLREVR